MDVFVVINSLSVHCAGTGMASNRIKRLHQSVGASQFAQSTNSATRLQVNAAPLDTQGKEDAVWEISAPHRVRGKLVASWRENLT
jgi:hypothetical protein